MLLKNFVFLDSESTSGTSSTFYNTAGKKMLLQVVANSGVTPSITVNGQVDAEKDTWVAIGGTNVSTQAAAATIGANGIFSYDITGIVKLQVVSTTAAASVKVFGTISD